MIRHNKKGFNLHILLALGIFVVVSITMTAIQLEKATVKNRPIGSAQTALLRAGAEGESAVIYLEKAADMAAQQSAEEFLKNSGCRPDPESNDYSCGSFAGTCTWNSNDDSCFPEFEKNLLLFFHGKLTPLLTRNTLYTYPAFSLITKPTKPTTTILAAQEETLTFSFTGGGTEGFALDSKALFTPDYLNAKVSTQLNSLNRKGQEIQHIIVHYTERGSRTGAESTLKNKGLSYHYIIETNGNVYQYVPETRSAQHAGCSKQEDPKCQLPGMNSQTIGISFVNCGYITNCGPTERTCYSGKEINNKCWQDYTKEQLDSFTNLVTDIVLRTPSLQNNGKMKADTLVMHSEVTGNKKDPGPAFTNKQQAIEQQINKNLQSQTSTVSVSNEEAPETANVESGRGYTGAKLTKKVQDQVEEHEKIINKYAKEYDLEPALIKAFITHESHGNATAESPTGALGLLQIIPSYHHDTRCVPECDFSKEINKEDYFNPEKNICCGAHLIKTLAQQAKPIIWSCCGQQFDKDICIDKTYTMPYEIAARRYNTARCEQWADPDFVESIMGLYIFYGGNPAQFRSSEQGVYYATYELPVGLKEEVNINLEPLEQIQETAKIIINTCEDNTKNCVTNILQEHNTTYPENSITQNCADNNLAIEFLQKTKSCQDFPDDIPCVFKIENQQAPTSFILRLSENNVEQNFYKSIARNNLLKSINIPTSELYISHYLDKTSKEVEHFTITFENNTDTIMTNILFDAKKLHIVTKKLQDYYYTFINKDKKFHYNTDIKVEEGQGYFEPIQKDYLFCFNNNNQQMNFSLHLDDKQPPRVKNIQYRYNATHNRYEIQWDPITTYTDETPISDIVAYKIYCSKQPLPKTNLPEETLSLTINPKKDYFKPNDYSNIEAMTGILDYCGGESVSMQPVNIVIVAEDAAGQIAFNYEQKPLFPLQIAKLQHPLLHQHYKQEVHTPESQHPLESATPVINPLTALSLP